MVIVRSETILAAMKALNMRDEDLHLALIGNKSKSGNISHFDLDLVNKLSKICYFKDGSDHQCLEFDTKALKETESAMSAVYIGGDVIVLVTDDQSRQIELGDLKTILAVNNVALDTLGSVKLDMGVDDSLRDNIVATSNVIQRILKAL